MLLILKLIGGAMLPLLVAPLLAVTIVPRFLDRIYYRGPARDHFDGERFFNADGDEETFRIPGGGSRFGFFWRYVTGSDGRPAWPGLVPVTPARPAQRIEGDRLVDAAAGAQCTDPQALARFR